MKLKCSCGGVAFATRRKFVYEGDATTCRDCGQPGHIAITDDYEDDAVASWHLDSECISRQRCFSLAPVAERPTGPAAAGKDGR